MAKNTTNILFHPPTTIQGTTCKHLDYSWVFLAFTFRRSLVWEFKTINVHFKLRNYDFIGFTEELSDIHSSLCFKNFVWLWWNCKWSKNMIVSNNMKLQISNEIRDIRWVCSFLFGFAMGFIMIALHTSMFFKILCIGLKRWPPHLYFMLWGGRWHCYLGCNLCC